ncbi:pyridoxal phosphate-dependent aminotransferase [Opitutaceae bacterium TAV4]|uniref:pyridoxal phosphate-dependent aminotransferase n=1 Tax=Geminisphaera colitermitum TaxID=1148786 RepID=UPI000158D5A4|nr:pyridoxal phosphate-dependent aminotransferase [Geminisphaera colitermitum]RRJ95524.1 pyridoxal phosphate-dependent aminotransferase [Opitutaceae bacterium TAV4]RRJ99832.1 pyridoxal phosphate-dependent aminotransferase [Opitutaceae bacterium TAV3]
MSSAPAPLSVWAKNISPSPTLAVDAKAKALLAAGEDVCGFAAGEPDFDTPEHIKEACIAALKAGKTKYAPTPGIEPLRQAIADDYAARLGLKVASSQVIVSPGGKFSCYLSILAVCSPGDEVIIPAPYWVSYPEMAKLAGAKPVFVLADDRTGFRLTPAQLEAAITPKSKLLILNSPSNPTGAVYTRAELEAIVAVALKHNLYIMSDEIYEHLLYDGAQHVSPATFSAEAAARTIIVSGFAKTYSMTGWRLGTTVAPAPIAKAVAELQSQTSSNATTFAQYGALAALKEKEKTQASLTQMLAAFDRRRKFLHAELNKIPGVKCLLAQGAFYLFPNISSFGLSSADFCSKLLEQQKVAAVFGSAFGAEGYLRLSYATSDEIIKKGVERLAAFCKTL